MTKRINGRRDKRDALARAVAGEADQAQATLSGLRDRVLEVMAEQDRPLDVGAVSRLAGCTALQAEAMLEHLVAHGQAEYQATGWYVLAGRVVVNGAPAAEHVARLVDGVYRCGQCGGRALDGTGQVAKCRECGAVNDTTAGEATPAGIIAEADQQLAEVARDLFGNGLPPKRSGPSATCQRCERPLSDPVSQAAGMGPVCRARASMGNGGADDPSQVAALPWDPATMDVVLRREPSARERGGDALANICQVVVHHSPTGFEWGYGGSGPADLALNVLQLFVPVDGGDPVKCYRGTCSATAWALHQPFKREFIAGLPDHGGTIPGDTIRQWLAGHGVAADVIVGAGQAAAAQA